MAGVNKAIIVGNLGRDPEMRSMSDGNAVANFPVATSDEWKDKNTGEKRERTEWHRIVAFRKLAEICGEYLTKGRQVYIEGRIQTREWEDKEGNRRWTTEIVADRMQMLGSKAGGSGSGSGRSSGGGATYDESGSGGGGKTGRSAPEPSGGGATYDESGDSDPDYDMPF